MTNIKLYFEPPVFYSQELESKLPNNKSEIIFDFQNFVREYKRMGNILEAQYSQNDENIWIVLGAKKGEIKPVNHEQYNILHSQYQTFKNYYQLLLIAVKNRYGIWLNDYLPEDCKTSIKKRKNKALK